MQTSNTATSNVASTRTTATYNPLKSHKPTPESKEAAGIYLNFLLSNLGLKNDAHLCRFLDVAAPVISKIRHGSLPVSAEVLIRIHEKTDISIKDLKQGFGMKTLND